MNTTLGLGLQDWPAYNYGTKHNMIDLDMNFRGSGRVTEWKFLAGRARVQMHMQVWRPSATKHHTYTLLCKNEVASTVVGLNTLIISDEDACRFERGDVVGWFGTNSAIKFVANVGDSHQMAYQYMPQVPTVGRSKVIAGRLQRSFAIEVTALYDDATASVCSDCGNVVDGEYRCAAGDHTSGGFCDGNTQTDTQTCDRCPNEYGMGMPNCKNFQESQSGTVLSLSSLSFYCRNNRRCLLECFRLLILSGSRIIRWIFQTSALSTTSRPERPAKTGGPTRRLASPAPERTPHSDTAARWTSTVPVACATGQASPTPRRAHRVETRALTNSPSAQDATARR